MDNETRTIEAVMAAYWSMTPEERQAIREQALQLMDRVKARTGYTKGFGIGSAIRLLGCLGMLVVKDGTNST